MYIKKIELKTEEDTKNLAEKIGPILKKKDFIALRGDLGAGKTAFSRYLIRGLGKDTEEVPSPTFTLVQFYDLPEFTVWHFDLYRIKHPEEVYELGWEEAMHDGVMLVEWVENADGLVPEDRLEIEMFFQDKTGTRIATLKGMGEMVERLEEIFS